MTYSFEPQPAATVAVTDGTLFPVRRIFCVGKNYADHVKEMGGDVKSDPPVFFTKPADAVVQNNAAIAYPPGTDNLHFEGELVVALGAGGSRLTSREQAGALIFGNAVGCDLTRRDLQLASKERGAPWDTAKAFDNSAPIAPISPNGDVTPAALSGARLTTRVNGETRQNAGLDEMIWTVPEIICALSDLFELKAGDLIFTGTPAGVGPLVAGDKVEIAIGELTPLSFSIE